MLEQGYTTEQIATEMMIRWGFRPRQAWRHAHGWTQQDVANRYNQLVNDGHASMTDKRISDYESWPPGGQKPTLPTLHMLARIYDTHPTNLVDFDDRAALDETEQLALPPQPLSTPEPNEPSESDSINSRAVPRQLPPRLPHFVGRERELRELASIFGSIP